MSGSSGFKARLALLRHDLRTPAGHVMGYAEMLEEEFEDGDSPEIESALIDLKQSGVALVDLIDEHLGGGIASPEDIDADAARRAFSAPMAVIAASCATLAPMLEDTEEAGDLEKIGRAHERLVILIAGVEDALSDTGDHARAKDVPSPSETQSVPSTSLLGEGGVILVVDDDAANRDLLGRKLRAQRYEPVPVEGGAEALEYLAHSEVDMILLDMIMPGLSGTDVLRRLKRDARLKNIPVVMLSALDDMEEIVESITQGAEDYLFKPPNPVLLKARISATLEKNRLRKQLAPRLKVFISSAGDVEPERLLAKRVMDRLNEELAGTVYMIPVLWEDEPLRASETAQTQIVAPRDTDIYVAIFWSRMGTMLPEHITRPDGSRYGSGTEFEFEDALAGHEQSGRPEILAYRKTAAVTVELADRTRVLDLLDQKEQLEQFIRTWFSTADGLSISRVYHAFESADEFEATLEKHLRKLAVDMVSADTGSPD